MILALVMLALGLAAFASGRRRLPLVVLLVVASVAVVSSERASAGADPCTPTTTTLVDSSSGTTTTAALTTTTEAPDTRVVAVTFTPTSTEPFCNVVVGMTGFLPNTDYNVVVTNTSDVGAFQGSPWSYDVTTDGAGAFSFTAQVFTDADPYNDAFGATVDGVSSGQQPISC